MMMAAMTIDDDIYELMQSADTDDMVLGEWSDEWSDAMEQDDGGDEATSQALPNASFSSMNTSEEILLDFYNLPSLEMLGYDEQGLVLPGLVSSSASSASSASSSSDESMDEDMAGSFLDRLQVTSRKLRESMKKSQETRKSLVLKTERTAKYADRVELVVKSVNESTDKLQTLLEKKKE